LPTWNPYLNFGFPLYADPGFAWWQPITWIFGFIGYNAYTFTLEVLLYIYISGLGMYWLGRQLGFHVLTAFAIGCMFMCCGFFIGNLQHVNFLTCAAFLPWLVGAWLQYQKHKSNKRLCYCCLAIYLVCTSGHPAIPLATFYFLSLLTILYYFIAHEKKALTAYIFTQLKLIGLSVLILLPLLLSYYQLLPFYTRFQPAVQAGSLNIGFTPPSYISFLTPFATIKNSDWYQTDVSMRNAYFSMAGFVLFVKFLFHRNKNRMQLTFVILLFFMLLLSAGGFVKKELYEFLPFLRYIRTNGEFRVFVIFSCIVCVSYEFEKLLAQKDFFDISAKRLFILTSAVLATTSCLTIIFMEPYIPLSASNASIVIHLKYLIDGISFTQSFFIAATGAFLLSLFYLYSFHKKNKLFFFVAFSTDIIINSWLLLPITGVSQYPVSKIHGIIERSPYRFPIPSLNDGKEKKKPLTQEEEKLIGNWNWYSKEIVYAIPIDYPSMLNSTKDYLDSADQNPINERALAFLKNNDGRIMLKRFSPTKFEFALAVANADTLVLLQNNFPGWRAWVNEKEATLSLYESTFLQVPVDEKTRKVSFYFSPL
jgi:hypothetical protein